MKTIILVDYDNLKEAAKKLNLIFEPEDMYNVFTSYHSESEINTLYAYVGINEKMPFVKDKDIDNLLRSKFIVRKVVGDTYGIHFISDCSQAITLDALRTVYENNATHVMIVSNSKKLVDLATILREKDIVVENVFFGSFANYDLAVHSSGFIDLEDIICYDEDELDLTEEGSVNQDDTSIDVSDDEYQQKF